MVVVHGETISEPVIPGTNCAAIESGCDILAHPGLICKEDVLLAAKKGVFLEITARASHSKPNLHVLKMARKCGAKLVFNTDSHAPGNLITDAERLKILKKLGVRTPEIAEIVRNSRYLVAKAVSKG